jgi:hypothetical protein
MISGDLYFRTRCRFEVSWSQRREIAEMIAPLLFLMLQATLIPQHGAKATVLLFVRSDCPISNRYAPDLERLYKIYSPRGIEFRLVYSEPGLTAEALKRHSTEYGYSIPALLDPDHRLAELAKADITPEAAVFVHGKLVYLGRIDDRYVSIGRARARPTSRDVEDELAAILAGKVPPFHQTEAVGCAIEALE